MIARFQVALPFILSIPADHELAPYDVEIDGYQARVYPPHRSQIDRSLLEPDSPAPLGDLNLQLDPLDPQPRAENIRIDGSQAIQADVLRVEFLREADFDRRAGVEDPPAELCFRIVNDLLARLRTLGRAQQVKPLTPRSTWRLEYLSDEGVLLEQQEGFHRAINSLSWTMTVFGLRADLWEATRALPDDFTPSPWDTLLLDAVALLPEIGPPIVLAFAAVETRIGNALDVLAPAAGLSNELWTWIRDRDGDYRKEPSVAEQIQVVLGLLSSHGLRDEPRLWEAFQNLKSARNSFVHAGTAVIGNDPVTPDRANQLVALAGEIIDWIEQRLPEDHRRPVYGGAADRAVEIQKLVVAPQEVPDPGGTGEE